MVNTDTDIQLLRLYYQLSHLS